MRFIYQDLKNQRKGQKVRFRSDGENLVGMLVTYIDYTLFRNGRPYQFHGGTLVKKRAFMEIPHDGEWVAVIRVDEFYGGQGTEDISLVDDRLAHNNIITAEEQTGAETVETEDERDFRKVTDGQPVSTYKTMIDGFKLENYGPITLAEGKNLGKINLVLGENSTGKTFLLKALYSAIRSHEESGKGNINKDFSEILSDKLYWTFQVDKIGDMVSKGAGKRLKTSIELNDKSCLVFNFGPDTTKKVSPQHNNLSKRESNSIFLPPKEVLSLTDVIHKSSRIDKIFGFDATYSDLVDALKIPRRKGRNYKEFSDARKNLAQMFTEKVEFETKSNRWIYKKGNRKYSIMSAAEGVKKIAILDTLLGNRFLDSHSVVFIDEPESALHPTAIVQLLDIVAILAQAGVQFFMATHSYYVIKKLALIANEQNIPIPTFMAQDDGTWQQSCLLKDGLPENEIINESIRLFEAEFEGIQ